MNAQLKRVSLSAGIALALALAASAHAEHNDAPRPQPKAVIELPLIPGWYDGQQIAYLQTEASDAGLAASQHANYVPKLALVLQGPVSFDDIYAVTNFTQANVVPSAPIPAGPGNANPDYSPLWQVSKVTWADKSKAYTLKSEAEVLAAAAAKLVTIEKTQIVVNCPIIYSPQGGTLPGASLETERARF